MRNSYRKKSLRQKKNRKDWFGKIKNIIVEIILIVWVVSCLFVSLIKFGTYGILLYGSTGKIPPQIVIVIQRSDQWLTQNVWRSN